MFYKTEFDIYKFPFWSGANDRIETATPEQIEQVRQRIESTFCDEENIPEDVDINDLVWFECDDIFYPEEEEEEDV